VHFPVVLSSLEAVSFKLAATQQTGTTLENEVNVAAV
jgi:hypothetical protein